MDDVILDDASFNKQMSLTQCIHLRSIPYRVLFPDVFIGKGRVGTVESEGRALLLSANVHGLSVGLEPMLVFLRAPGKPMLP